jgi:hypothetical protein
MRDMHRKSVVDRRRGVRKDITWSDIHPYTSLLPVGSLAGSE